eukprot:g72005.t1
MLRSLGVPDISRKVDKLVFLSKRLCVVLSRDAFAMRFHENALCAVQVRNMTGGPRGRRCFAYLHRWRKTTTHSPSCSKPEGCIVFKCVKCGHMSIDSMFNTEEGMIPPKTIFEIIEQERMLLNLSEKRLSHY